jgi:hypothetical protein
MVKRRKLLFDLIIVIMQRKRIKIRKSNYKIKIKFKLIK